jgi:NAD+ synthase (glutamine-hydrolysing)
LKRPNYEDFSIFVEICEDVWTPIPPSTFGALAGATVLANLSASNITIGKLIIRRDLWPANRQVHRGLSL